jgi:hypothetical protein
MVMNDKNEDGAAIVDFLRDHMAFVCKDWLSLRGASRESVSDSKNVTSKKARRITTELISSVYNFMFTFSNHAYKDNGGSYNK